MHLISVSIVDVFKKKSYLKFGELSFRMMIICEGIFEIKKRVKSSKRF